MVEDEQDRTCSAYSGEEKRLQSFGGEIWREETTWDTYKYIGG